MSRQLKHHEKKLLKRTNLYQYPDKEKGKMWSEKKEQEARRIFRLGRNDYRQYLMMSISLRRIMDHSKKLDITDPVRHEVVTGLMTKLQSIGLLHPHQNKLVDIGRVPPEAFCRRRLAVRVNELKMAPTIDDAITFIEHGHVRVGTEVVFNPSYLVPVDKEDYITWVDNSSIKKKIQRHLDQQDDYIHS